MGQDNKNAHICNIGLLPNFRVVHENVTKPFLYRSSRPDFLEGDDLLSFNSLGIKTIIDLRSASSYKKLDAPKEIDKLYKPYTVSLPQKRKYGANEIVKCIHLDSDSFKPTNVQVLANHFSTPRKHVFVDFMNTSCMMYFLRKLPIYLIIYAVFLMLYDVIFRTGFRNFIHFQSKYTLNELGPAEVLGATLDFNENLVCSGNHLWKLWTICNLPRKEPCPDSYLCHIKIKIVIYP